MRRTARLAFPLVLAAALLVWVAAPAAVAQAQAQAEVTDGGGCGAWVYKTTVNTKESQEACISASGSRIVPDAYTRIWSNNNAKWQSFWVWIGVWKDGAQIYRSPAFNCLASARAGTACHNVASSITIPSGYHRWHVAARWEAAWGGVFIKSPRNAESKELCTGGFCPI
jgi:hypothetical protein